MARWNYWLAGISLFTLLWLVLLAAELDEQRDTGERSGAWLAVFSPLLAVLGFSWCISCWPAWRWAWSAYEADTGGVPRQQQGGTREPSRAAAVIVVFLSLGGIISAAVLAVMQLSGSGGGELWPAVWGLLAAALLLLLLYSCVSGGAGVGASLWLCCGYSEGAQYALAGYQPDAEAPPCFGGLGGRYAAGTWLGGAGLAVTLILLAACAGTGSVQLKPTFFIPLWVGGVLLITGAVLSGVLLSRAGDRRAAVDGCVWGGFVALLLLWSLLLGTGVASEYSWHVQFLPAYLAFAGGVLLPCAVAMFGARGRRLSRERKMARRAKRGAGVGGS